MAASIHRAPGGVVDRHHSTPGAEEEDILQGVVHQGLDTGGAGTARQEEAWVHTEVGHKACGVLLRLAGKADHRKVAEE